MTGDAKPLHELDYVVEGNGSSVGGNLRHGDFNTLDRRVLRHIVERFAVRSALDVGCGEGHLVFLLSRLGVMAHGIDGSLKNVMRSVYPIALHDLARAPYVMPVDLVVSIEVAEHIEERYVSSYLDTLCNGTVVMMTHALPGQGGHHHVNCQPSSYWTALMAARGYRLDYQNDWWKALAARENAESFFGASGLLFVRQDP